MDEKKTRGRKPADVMVKEKAINAELPEPAIEVGDRKYFTTKQLAAALQVNEYNIVNVVRSGGLHGRKVGNVKIICAEEFHEWVIAGNMQKQPYTKAEAKAA